MQSLDLPASLFALALLAVGALCYGARVLAAGAVRSARVAQAGGSLLLGLDVMEFGYWCLQPIGRACVRAGLSPNQITGLSLLFGLGGGVAAAAGHLGVGALLVGISALGDVLDGLVARTTGGASAGGAIFDASVDRYTEFFLLGGLAFLARSDGPLLALALLCILGSFMISYGSAKAEGLRVPVPRGVMRRAERAVYLCGGLLLSPLAAALVAAGRLPSWCARAPLLVALALVAIVSNVSAALRLRAVARAGSAKVAAPSLLIPRPSLPPVDALAAAPLRVGRSAAQH